jgi:hypothetical protein
MQDKSVKFLTEYGFVIVAFLILWLSRRLLNAAMVARK